MEIDKRIYLRARRADMSLGPACVELYGYQKDSRGRAEAAKLNMVECEEAVRLEPFVIIGNVQAQVLMDDLWAAGVRPTEGRGSAGVMEAVQSHLKDLRNIAFKKLGIE